MRFLILLALIQPQIGLIFAQHSTCRNAEEPAGTKVLCDETIFSLPGNFDVTQLPADLLALEIWLHPEGPLNNVVHENYTAFPARPQLTEVEMWCFNTGEKQPRFPLNGLLANNKQHITALTLQHVKLLTLSEADFAGFSVLSSLRLVTCHLTSVDVSTFAGLAGQPSGHMIHQISITKNPNLTSIDWSVFKPIADNVEQISLEENNITTAGLTCSSPFKLTRCRRIELSQNQIHPKFPAAIYQTFTPTVENFEINLGAGEDDGQKFCKGGILCDCCEMYEFEKWLLDNNVPTVLNRLYCGNDSYNKFNPLDIATLTLNPSCANP